MMLCRSAGDWDRAQQEMRTDDISLIVVRVSGVGWERVVVR
jgi:hypothetical protein